MPEATLATIFVTSFIVGLSGAMSPGPLLAFDVKETTRIGFWAGPSVTLGHAVLEAVAVVLLALGASRFLRDGPAVAAISLAGGAFLLWMGWDILRAPARGLPSRTEGARLSPRPQRGTVLGGALVSLSNPFWALWWATLGTTYIVWSLELGAAGLASFYTGHIFSDLAWYSLVSLAIASGRRFMGGVVYRGVMVTCGLSLWAIGGFFLYRGMQALVA